MKGKEASKSSVVTTVKRRVVRRLRQYLIRGKEQQGSRTHRVQQLACHTCNRHPTMPQQGVQNRYKPPSGLARKRQKK